MYIDPTTSFPRTEAAACGAQAARRYRGFSLVEILLSIFILGIGMIMVASIFPVGANWTRQATEETVGQTISQNAVSVLQQYYGPGGPLNRFMKPDSTNGSPNTILANTTLSPYHLQALPQFIPTTAFPNDYIPIELRAYQFGSASPFPAANPAGCTYFWTALARLNPAHRVENSGTNHIRPSTAYTYDIFILVFRKGDANHQFRGSNPSPPEVPNMRLAPAHALMPRVVRLKYSKGSYLEGVVPPVAGAVPGVGVIAIGETSGTVFRQGFDPALSHAVPRPLLKGQVARGDVPTEDILYAPGPDWIEGVDIGASSFDKSPLIYVYQTTLTL